MNSADLELETLAQIAASRARYDALKAAGTGASPKAMPEPTALDGAPINAGDFIQQETIPGGWYANYRLKAGERIRISSPSGTSTIALAAWNANDTSERTNHADSIKIQWTAGLAKGRVIFSDMGRVLLSIVEDTSGAHDVLAGGLSEAGVAAKYGANPNLRNTRGNLVLAASKFGLDRRDIPTLINFFAPVSVAEDSTLTWQDGVRKEGDFVELRADMDVLIALSNCPHPLDPSPTYTAGDVAVTLLNGAQADSSDFCRTATVEAQRGFENNDTYRVW
jgi:urea carboxylase-associated protein 2